jgi:hypothetical protein
MREPRNGVFVILLIWPLLLVVGCDKREAKPPESQADESGDSSGGSDPNTERQTSEVTGQAIRNGSTSPMMIAQVTDYSGGVTGGLYAMPGETMVLQNGKPASGAGYYEGAAGGWHFVLFAGDYCGLHVDKVQWDKSGKTVAIEGLRPFVDAEKQIKITSDVKKPKLVDGILYLKLEGRGDVEYGFKIVYGQGISVDPPLFTDKINKAP